VICLVAAIFAIKTQPLFAHELNEGFLKGFPPSTQASLGVLIFLLLFLVGLGILWAAIAALLISGPYLYRREQILVSILLVGMAGLPVGYHGVAARHAVASSHEFALVQAIDQGGRGETLVQQLHGWIQAAPQSGLPHYYLGLVLKRRGEVPQAEAEMRKAAELLPRAGFVQVGLGNALYLQGRVQEAEAAYRQAAEITPSSAAAQLNLSRLYVQRLQLDQSEEALARSRSLDPHMVRTVLSFQGQGSAPLVMDEAVPWKNLATDLAPRVELMSVIADGLWGGQLRGISLHLLPYAAVLLVIAFWVYVPLRERRMPARRCEQCGTPFCSKCQFNPKERACCASCAAVFRQREGVAAFVRTRRLREVEEWGRKERMRARILGVVLPGGSDLYQGRVLIGVLLCGATAWLFIEGVVLDTVTPSLRFSPSLPVPFRVAAVLVPLAVLYGYSLWRSRRKISRISN
jgi:tetratricopeptide (TPR) repeat protein